MTDPTKLPTSKDIQRSFQRTLDDALSAPVRFTRRGKVFVLSVEESK